MTRAQVVERIEQTGIVPVVRVGSARLALHALEALAAGGIALVEITMTVPDAIAVIREATARFDRVWVGAGTVLSSDQARVAIAAGARFVVSPGFDRELVRAAQALDLLC